MRPIAFRAKPGEPCPACGSDSKGCSVTDDGLHLCRGEPGADYFAVTAGPDEMEFGHYRRVEDRQTSAPPTQPRWVDLAFDFASAMTDDRRAALARELRLPADAVYALPGIGWNEDHGGPHWTFPEVDGGLRVVGITRRYAGGTKKAMGGGSRGLTVPPRFADSTGPVFVVEGASDVLALSLCGLAAVGRPNNAGGAEQLAALLRAAPRDRLVYVMGENDRKSDGKWPGRDGAEKVARRLAELLGAPARVAFPPDGVKDCRAWVLDFAAGMGEAEDWRAVGRDIAAAAWESAEVVGGPNAAKAAAWEPVIPLADLPPVPAFPLDALPRELAEFVSDVAGATNSPPDFAGGYAIAIAAGTVGATRAVSIKDGYIQRGSIYLATVGRKGGAKSPPLEHMAKPVYDEQARKKRGGKKEKVFTSDVTAEKLAGLMQENTRGVLMIRDELAGWLLSFNQYKSGGKGADRQFFLSAWSGAPVAVDRKGKKSEGDDGEIYVRWPCLSVLGSIQPSVLDKFRADADDGFYDRMLFCYPDELPTVGETWATIRSARADRWAGAVAALREVPMTKGEDGDDRPLFLRLTDDARVVWKAWTDDIARLVNAPDFDEILRGPYVKLAGYAARLALVSHMLRGAYGEAPLLAGLGGPVPMIDGEDMRRGVALGRYFLGHAVRVWNAAGLDARFGPARRLLSWVRNAGVAGFTRRDAHRAMLRAFPSAEDLSAPLRTLVEHGFLRHAEGREARPAPGRQTAPYEVHPDLCQRCQRVNTVSASSLTVGAADRSAAR